MPFLTLCVLAGAYALGWCPTLPPDELFLPLVLLGAACAWKPRMRAGACAIAGFSGMWLGAWFVIDNRLEPRLAGQTIAITAGVLDFPVARDATVRFTVAPRGRADLPARIRLSWHRPVVRPRPGETWQLRVRLRRPRAYANPDGFDYEGYLFRERIGATGYVVEHDGNRRLTDRATAPLAGMRRAFVERVGALLPDDDATAVLLAIAVGARHKITREQWDRYAATGTSHLMAISGLHVGLAAGGVMTLAWPLLTIFLARSNTRDLALIAAVLAAAVYVILSGLAVPAQRALLMAVLGAGAVLCRRRINPALLVSLPCLLMFFVDPVSIHAPGFKLSFAAVTIILWTLQQYTGRVVFGISRAGGGLLQSFKRLVGLQLALLIGLFPLTILIFGRFTFAAPLANLLVLPLFNFIAVPFCLLGMLLCGPLSFLGDALLGIAHASISGVLGVVRVLASLPGVRFDSIVAPGLTALLVVVPAIHVLLPPGWPGRKLAMLTLAAGLFARPAPVPPGCLDWHVLDVGQGLAVVLRTEATAILYDTGPAFRSGGSTAALVIAPFLKSRGVRRLDTLILSHADLDHAGGADDIAAAFPIDRVLAGEFVTGLDLEQRRCGDLPSFALRAIQFRILHPANGAAWEGNNASCVLEVAVGHHILLIGGDIERPVESLLLREGRLRSVATVIVPHHGSKTSSSPAFVARLQAQRAIISAGYGNRWGLPGPDVRRRWESSGATVINTAEHGAVSQRVCAAGSAGPLRLERQLHRKYWHE